MKEYPLVSIVTPSYNQGRFIRETIDSVLTQDYPHIEYLVMDGGSRDETIEILNSYGGRLRWESRPDGGQGDAINKGFAASRGQIFAFLNSDDTYLPGAVGAAVEAMLANPSAGMVYGEANWVDEEGTPIRRYQTLPFDAAELSRNCFICQPASFVRRDVFESVGGINARLHLALDYDLWIRIAQHYRLLKIDPYLATSRVHAETKSVSQRGRHFREAMTVVAAHYGYVPFSWINGFTESVLDREHPWDRPGPPTPAKQLFCLAWGMALNWKQPVRWYREWSAYVTLPSKLHQQRVRWREWAAHAGLAGEFHGRHHDGWISRRYVSDAAVPTSCRSIRIAGRHEPPFRRALRLTVRMNGRLLASRRVQQRGPFSLVFSCPTELRGRESHLEIEAGPSFHPIRNGDFRRLSCILDSITFHEEPAEHGQESRAARAAASAEQ